MPSKFTKILSLLLLIFIIAIFIFSYKLNQVPTGINLDETSIGYNAALISKTLKDENGRLLPIFILTLDKTDWKQPVTMYTTAIFFKLFGISLFNLRLVSVIFAALSVMLLFILLTRLFNTRKAVLFSGIFVTMPQIIIQSHLALENIAAVPFTVLWLLSLILFESSKKLRYLTLAALTLGIGFYSYNGMRLMVPIFILASLVYLYYLKSKIRDYLHFILILTPFGIMLPIINLKYAGALTNNSEQELMGKRIYQDFIYPYISNLDISFLFLKGDTSPIHSTGYHGMFLLATLPIFLIGIYFIIKSHNFFIKFVLLLFLTSPILYMFTDSIYRASRLMPLTVFAAVIMAYGLNSVMNIKNRVIKNLLCIGVVVLIGINFIDFARNYYLDYPKHTKILFKETKYYSLLGQLNAVAKKLNKTPYIQEDIYNKEDTANKLFELATVGEDKLYYWNSSSPIPENALILIASDKLGQIPNKDYKTISLENNSYLLLYQ